MSNGTPAVDYTKMNIAAPRLGPVSQYEPEPEWKKGLAAFADEMQALGGGVVGLAGQAGAQVLPEVARPTAEAVRDWGLDTYRRNIEESTAGWQAPDVARIEDIKLGEEGGLSRLGDWAQYQGAKGLATLGSLALSGGVGGAVAKTAMKKGIKDLAKHHARKQAGKTVNRELERSYKREATKALESVGKEVTESGIERIGAQALGKVRRGVTRGAVVGGGAGAFGLEGGGAFGQQVTEEGVAPADALLPSIGVGGINAALELVAPLSVAKKLGLGSWAKRGVAQVIKKEPALGKRARQLAARIAKGGLTTAAQEGVTEGLQELVQLAGSRVAQDKELLAELSEEDRSQILNAAAAGGLTGGLFGGAAGPFVQPSQRTILQQEVVEELPPEVQALVTPETTISSPVAGESRVDYLARVLQEVTNEAAAKAAAKAESEKEAATGAPEEGVQPAAEEKVAEPSPVVDESAEPIIAEAPPTQVEPEVEVDASTIREDEGRVLEPGQTETEVPTDRGGDREQIAAERREAAGEVSPAQPLEGELQGREVAPAEQVAGALERPYLEGEVERERITQRQGQLEEEYQALARPEPLRLEAPKEDKLESQTAPEERTVQQVEKATIDELGSGWLNRARKVGLVEIKDEAGDRGQGGEFDRNTGKITIFAKSLGKGNPVATVLHEASHASMEMLTQGRLGKFAQEVRNQAGKYAQGEKIPKTDRAAAATMAAESAKRGYLARRFKIEFPVEDWRNPEAVAQVDAAIEQKLAALSEEDQAAINHDADVVFNEETFAYFVQFAHQANKSSGLLRRGLNAIKAGWLTSDVGKALSKVGLKPKISDEVAVALARQSTKYAVELREEMRQLAAETAAVEGSRPGASAIADELDPDRLFSEVTTQYTEGLSELMRKTGGNPAIAARRIETASLHPATRRLAHERGVLHFMTQKDALGTIKAPLSDLVDGFYDPETSTFLSREDAKKVAQMAYGTTDKPMDEKQLESQELRRTQNIAEAPEITEPEMLDVSELSPETLKRFEELGLKREIVDNDIEEVVDPNPWISETDKSVVRQIDREMHADKPALERVGEGLGTGASTDDTLQSVSQGISDAWEASREFVVGNEARFWERSRFSRFQGWLQDRFNELKRYQKKIVEKTGQALPEAQQAYEAETASHGIKTERVRQFRADYQDRMLKKLADNDLTVEDADEAVYANHAQEANNRGRLVNAKKWWKDLSKDVDPAIRVQMEKEKDNLWARTKIRAERQKELLALLRKYADDHGSPEFQVQWNDFYERPSGMSDRESIDLMKKWSKNPVMMEVLDIFDDMNRQVPTWYHTEGMMTAEMAAKWAGAYDHYATLRREGYDDTTGGGTGRGYSASKPSPIRKFSTRQAVNPFTNTIWKAESAIQKVENNKVIRSLADLITAHPDPNFMTVKKHDKVPYLDKDGFIQEGATKSISADDTVFWRNGEPMLISAATGNQRAASIIHGMNNLESPELGPILRNMRKGVRFMAQLNTSLSPEFFFTNLTRDWLTAQYNMSDSEAGQFRKQINSYYLPSAKALRTVLRAKSQGLPVNQGDEWVQWANKFEKAGGRTGWMDVYEDTQQREKALKKRMKEIGEAESFHKRTHQVAQFIEDYNAVAENAMRLATFRALVENGVPVRRAVSLDKDLTVNFNRRGTAAPAINALYMFAGAGIQGSARILSALKSPAVRKMVYGTIAFSFVVDQLNRSFDDEGEYDEIPDYQKERNLIFANPLGKGYLTIPAPWGYNTVWAIGQKLSEGFSHAKGDLPDWSLLKAGSDLVSTAFNAFMPIQGGSMLQALSPTVFDPLVQIGENKDPFGRKLKPEPFPNQTLPLSEQYWSTVSDFSRHAARLVNKATGGDDVTEGWGSFSPEWTDAIFAQMFGAVGKQLQDVGELPALAWEGETELRDVPIARKLVAFAGKGQAAALYHDRVARALKAERIADVYSEGPRADREALQEHRKEYRAELRTVSMAKDTERQIRDLRSQKRQAEARGQDSRVDYLTDKITQQQERFNQSWLRRVGN